MMNLHLYNKIFYLMGFLSYNALRGCITYVCGACGECVSLSSV
jgi:hypothetical protein